MTKKIKTLIILILSILVSYQNKLEAQDNMEAYSKGFCYKLDGKYREAFEVFKKACDAGDRRLCAFELGECYFQGIGCEQDLQKAFFYHLMSAENDHPEGAYVVAMDYYNGFGCEKNDNEAFKWNKKASEDGHPYAPNNYASMLAKGEGCKKDLVEAFKWYLKAANNGEPMAQYTVGCCYYYGDYNGENIGINKDYVKAKEYLLKSAKNGHPMAAIRLDEWFK